MNWLESIGLKLAISWGIPTLATLVPWVPAPVWAAISAILQHLAGLESDAERVKTGDSFHANTHAVIGASAPHPSDLVK